MNKGVQLSSMKLILMESLSM